MHGQPLGDEDLAARQMGLAEIQFEDTCFNTLFSPRMAQRALGHMPTAAEAAKVIRHFALTGEEDWSVAR